MASATAAIAAFPVVKDAFGGRASSDVYVLHRILVDDTHEYGIAYCFDHPPTIFCKSAE